MKGVQLKKKKNVLERNANFVEIIFKTKCCNLEKEKFKLYECRLISENTIPVEEGEID